MENYDITFANKQSEEDSEPYERRRSRSSQPRPYSTKIVSNPSDDKFGARRPSVVRREARSISSEREEMRLKEQQKAEERGPRQGRPKRIRITSEGIPKRKGFESKDYKIVMQNGQKQPEPKQFIHHL